MFSTSLCGQQIFLTYHVSHNPICYNHLDLVLHGETGKCLQKLAEIFRHKNNIFVLNTVIFIVTITAEILVCLLADFHYQ